jgi:hypothetical protein
LSEWQPIETAPKDGRFVQVRTRDGQETLGFWDEWQERWMTGWQSEKGDDPVRGDVVSWRRMNDTSPTGSYRVPPKGEGTQ